MHLKHFRMQFRIYILSIFFLTNFYSQNKNDLFLLQKIINSNQKGIVYLEKNKTYIINGTLTVPDFVKINGNGASILQTKDNTPIINLSYKSDINIENINFTGKGNDYQPSASSLAVGINIWGAKNINITNCIFRSFSNTGIAGLRQVQNIKINNNKFYGTSNNNPNYYQKDHTGITIGGKNIFIKNNYITKSSQGIIIAEGSNNADIENNIIENITLEHGIYVDTSCQNIYIRKNNLFNIDGAAIKVQNRNYINDRSEHIIISDNIIKNTKGDGILILNSEASKSLYAVDVNVTNNTLDNIGQHGINIRNTKNIVVFNNRLNTIKNSGFYLRDSYSVNIKGNTINNTGENGVFDEGDSSSVNIIENRFENIATAGNYKNGLSACIFMENGEKRRIEKNIITGSKGMDYAIFIANGNLKDCFIEGNDFSNASKSSIRINQNVKNYKSFNNNRTSVK